MSDLMNGSSSYAAGTIDTASTIVNNVTATDADQPNGMADGILQIEDVLGNGSTLIGSTTDLVARLAVEHNADGTQKTLPVTKGGTAKTYDVVPTGVILVWTTTTAPTGFLLCDASAVNRTTYADLFAVIGTTYGVGDGATTFNLPDLRGRVVIMVDGAANRITASSTNGGNADTLGGVGGAETHTLTTAELASHTHQETAADGGTTLKALTYSSAGGGANYDYIASTAGAAGTAAALNTQATGGGGAHSNTQPWIALNYVIKY